MAKTTKQQTEAPKIEAPEQEAPKVEAPRPDDLVTLQLDPTSRVTKRWIVHPLFKGRERWFDKTKIHAFDDAKKQVTVKRTEVQHRGMEEFILAQ